jgi:predicted flap endonuclease-1-like 5' DNA nuclease
MKPKKILKQASKNAKNQYVRKKDFKKLADEVSRLREALRKLEGGSGEGAPDSPEPSPKQPKTAQKSAPAPADPGGANQSELERINGIGPVLAGKLNALGITHIGQVAAFTQADIDRISEHLNFKGRIERDEWVQQAQKLGGA